MLIDAAKNQIAERAHPVTWGTKSEMNSGFAAQGASGV